MQYKARCPQVWILSVLTGAKSLSQFLRLLDFYPLMVLVGIYQSPYIFPSGLHYKNPQSHKHSSFHLSEILHNPKWAWDLWEFRGMLSWVTFLVCLTRTVISLCLLTKGQSVCLSLHLIYLNTLASASKNASQHAQCQKKSKSGFQMVFPFMAVACVRIFMNRQLCLLGNSTSSYQCICIS